MTKLILDGGAIKSLRMILLIKLVTYEIIDSLKCDSVYRSVKIRKKRKSKSSRCSWLSNIHRISKCRAKKATTTTTKTYLCDYECLNNTKGH